MIESNNKEILILLNLWLDTATAETIYLHGNRILNYTERAIEKIRQSSESKLDVFDEAELNGCLIKIKNLYAETGGRPIYDAKNGKYNVPYTGPRGQIIGDLEPKLNVMSKEDMANLAEGVEL